MLKEINWEIANLTWDDELLKNGCNNFYQSYSNAVITEVEEKGQKKFFTFSKDDQTIIWAMCCIKDKYCIIPFGPYISDNVTSETFKLFLDTIKLETNTTIIFTVNDESKNKFKSITEKMVVDWDFTTIILDLKNKNMDQIRKNFSENRRRIIKKSLEQLKDSIITEGIDNAEDFYFLYQKRMFENNFVTEFDLDFLKLILEQKNTGVVMCRNANYQPMSGLVYFVFGDVIITRYNAFDSEFQHLNPGSYLDFHMIARIVNDNNLFYYDMSGYATDENSSQKSLNINRYKETYGSKKLVNYKTYRY